MHRLDFPPVPYYRICFSASDTAVQKLQTFHKKHLIFCQSGCIFIFHVSVKGSSVTVLTSTESTRRLCGTHIKKTSSRLINKRKMPVQSVVKTEREYQNADLSQRSARSRMSLWTPDQTLEPQDERIRLRFQKRYFHH